MRRTTRPRHEDGRRSRPVLIYLIDHFRTHSTSADLFSLEKPKMRPSPEKTQITLVSTNKPLPRPARMVASSPKGIDRHEGYPIDQTTSPGRLDALPSLPHPCPSIPSREDCHAIWVALRALKD